MTPETAYYLLQIGQITLSEYLRTQELPSETINRIRKAVEKYETNKKKEGMRMNKRLDIELYEENQNYCAYIGEIGSSGYKCEGSTPKECAEQVKNYVIEAFNRNRDE